MREDWATQEKRGEHWALVVKKDLSGILLSIKAKSPNDRTYLFASAL